MSEYLPESLATFLGRFHVVAVHFPIALIMVAALLELVRRKRSEKPPLATAYTCLWLGALAAAVAVATGWLYAEVDPPSRSAENAVFQHRWSAVACGSLAVIAVILGAFAKRFESVRASYRLSLFLSAVMAGVASHLGGGLVHGDGFLLDAFRNADAVEGEIDPGDEQPAPTGIGIANAPGTAQASSAPTSSDTPPEPDTPPVPAAAAGGDDDAPLAAAGLAALTTSTAADDAPDDSGSAAAAEFEAAGSGAAVAGTPTGVEPEPLATAALAASASTPTLPVDYARDVRPILSMACYECHGPRRAKGRLRLHDMPALFAGDAAEWLIVPGDPDASELIRRVRLPASDDEIMPEEGGPLPAAQIATLVRWVEEGARYEDASAIPSVASGLTSPPPDIGTEPEPEAAAAAGASTGAAAGAGVGASTGAGVGAATGAAAGAGAGAEALAGTSAPAVVSAEQDPVSRAALDSLRAAGVVAGPLAAGHADVDVNVSRTAEPLGDEIFDALAPLAPRLVGLDLSRSSVTPAGLARLSEFPRLRRLRLDHTAVDDTLGATLPDLGELQILNLVDTGVGDDLVPALVAAPGLRRVYLWHTEVTPEACEHDRDDLELVLGAETLPSVAAEADDAPMDAESETSDASGDATGDPSADAPAVAVAACCAAAEAKGEVCDHPCCVTAAAEGQVCPKCAG